MKKFIFERGLQKSTFIYFVESEAEMHSQYHLSLQEHERNIILGGLTKYRKYRIPRLKKTSIVKNSLRGIEEGMSPAQ